MTHDARALLDNETLNRPDSSRQKSTASNPGTKTAGARRSPPRPDAKTRVQFDLPARSMAILAELKDKTDAASYAEVFKNALKLYDGLITEVERGSEFLVRDKAGNLASFRMFL